MRRSWLILLTISAFGADRRPAVQVQPREETLSSDRFAEIHAPLFAPKNRPDPGAATGRLAASLQAGESGATHARRNFIDGHVFGKMERDGVRPAPLASDYEFLRRLSLDLTGRIPSAEQVKEFLADQDPVKRDELIDKLLDRESFVDKWAYFFMDLFRANGKMGRGQNLFHYWMKENLRVDRPYDEVARDMIAASAKSNHVVAASNVIAREHVQGKAQPDDGKDLGMVQQLDTHDELAVLYVKTFLSSTFPAFPAMTGAGTWKKSMSGSAGASASSSTSSPVFSGAAATSCTGRTASRSRANSSSTTEIPVTTPAAQA